MALTLNQVLTWLRNNLLVVLTVSGAIMGVVVGMLVRGMDISQDAVIWIGLPGDVYMNSLKMVILPLIVSSVISGTASMDPRSNGRVSLVAFSYILITNSLSCVIPVAIILASGLGKGVDDSLQEVVFQQKDTKVMETSDVFSDLIRNIFPANIVAAAFQQSQTRYKTVPYTKDDLVDSNNVTSTNQTTEIMKTVKYVGTVSAANVLGLVVCSVLLGMATAAVGKEGKPFLSFFQSANTVIIKIMSWLVWSTPIGVISLIAVAFIKASHLELIIKYLGLCSLTIIACLILHAILLAIIVILVILRTNPSPILSSLGRPLVVTFGVCSSVIPMQEIFHALEEKNGLDKRITRFTVPLCATLNRDGSAMFMAASSLFVCNLVGYELGAGQVFLIWILTTVLSFAVPAVPSSSIVCIVIILTSLGIPTDLVGVLFATEWFVDRCRTVINVYSTCICGVLTNHFCKHHLPPLDMTEDKNDSMMGDKDSKHKMTFELYPSDKTICKEKDSLLIDERKDSLLLSSKC